MDPHSTRDAEEESEEITGSIDDSGSTSRYIISNASAEDAWLSIPANEAPALADWR